MFNVYVYYRIDSGHEHEAEISIRAVMARMTHAGVGAELLKKCDEPLLWMESYAGIVDKEAFLRELSRLADEYDVNVFIDGERHLECFHCDQLAWTGR